jgi:prepilin-type N-terminal cleavage/methylation domain-containing protein
MNAPTQQSARQRQRGFTLIESAVTIVILSIIMGVVSRLFLGAASGYTSAATRSELHSELSCALDRMVAELRLAAVKTGVSPSCADITSVTPTSIQWMAADGQSRQVSLVGSEVQYSVGGGTGFVLASSVTTFSIAAFDESNAALAGTLSGSAVNAVRRIRIDLSGTRQGVTETFRTRVFPRACQVGAGA